MKHRKLSYTKPLCSFTPKGPLRPGSDDFRSIPSKQTTVCSTERKTTQYYSGDKLLGIATMHKSNAVPITKDSDMAIATAKMRRG